MKFHIFNYLICVIILVSLLNYRCWKLRAGLDSFGRSVGRTGERASEAPARSQFRDCVDVICCLGRLLQEFFVWNKERKKKKNHAQQQRRLIGMHTVSWETDNMDDIVGDMNKIWIIGRARAHVNKRTVCESIADHVIYRCIILFS